MNHGNLRIIFLTIAQLSQLLSACWWTVEITANHLKRMYLVYIQLLLWLRERLDGRLIVAEHKPTTERRISRRTDWISFLPMFTILYLWKLLYKLIIIACGHSDEWSRYHLIGTANRFAKFMGLMKFSLISSRRIPCGYDRPSFFSDVLQNTTLKTICLSTFFYRFSSTLSRPNCRIVDTRAVVVRTTILRGV